MCEGSIELYRELFKLPDIHPIKLLESFARDGHHLDSSFLVLLEPILRNSFDFSNAFSACWDNGNEQCANTIARAAMRQWHYDIMRKPRYHIDPSETELKSDNERRKKRKIGS